MRAFHAAILSASMALPVAMSGAIVPAHAQSNGGVLGQAQRFLNGNQDQNQNTYEQGRQDQMMEDQARRQQLWQGNNPYTQNQYSQGYHGQYQQQTHQPYNNGYGYNNSYNTGTNNNGGYSNGYNNSYNGNYGYSR
jgi:opacity protein-like surface antigen